MITEVEEFEPATIGTAAEAEQDLLFIGTHSSTAIVRIWIIQDGKQVVLELQTPELRNRVLSTVIDELGNGLARRREEEGQA